MDCQPVPVAFCLPLPASAAPLIEPCLQADGMLIFCARAGAGASPAAPDPALNGAPQPLPAHPPHTCALHNILCCHPLITCLASLIASTLSALGSRCCTRVMPHTRPPPRLVLVFSSLSAAASGGTGSDAAAAAAAAPGTHSARSATSSALVAMGNGVLASAATMASGYGV